MAFAVPLNSELNPNSGKEDDNHMSKFLQFLSLNLNFFTSINKFLCKQNFFI